ncbi:MAG: hypothetical protein QOD84_1305 [Acidobacteriaceae bacterium]|jgi:hypothetical protein
MLPTLGTIPVTYDFERTPSIFIVSLQRSEERVSWQTGLMGSTFIL